MREIRPSVSVEGVRSNPDPYSDCWSTSFFFRAQDAVITEKVVLLL